MEHTYDFDLAVIGSGPGGQKAAIMAAKLGRKVCVIDSKAMVGGVCVNTGTIPSKTLREAVMYLTGMQLRDSVRGQLPVKEEITISDCWPDCSTVIGRETEVIRSQLMRNHIELIAGSASFLDPHTLSIDIEGSGRIAP
jgi:NAD(P) transhydrogenase